MKKAERLRYWCTYSFLSDVVKTRQTQNVDDNVLGVFVKQNLPSAPLPQKAK